MVVLFDLDGTLCDHAGADREAALALRAVVAPGRRPETFLADWGAAQARWYERYLGGAVSFVEHRRGRVRDVLGRRLGDREADLAFEFYLSAYRKACRLFDDVLPCLAALSGVRLGLITNGDGVAQRRKIEVLGLSAFFDVAIISGEVGMAKPDARIFALACARIGAAPQEAIFIGDDRRVDAEGARAAGLRGVWLDRADGPSDERWRIGSLAAAPALLARAARCAASASISGARG